MRNGLKKSHITKWVVPVSEGQRPIRTKLKTALLTGTVLSLSLLGSSATAPLTGSWGISAVMAKSSDKKAASEGKTEKVSRKDAAEAAAKHLAMPTAPVTASQPAGAILLPEGMRVKLELLDELKSNKLHQGVVVHYTLLDNLLGPNKQVLVPKGTPAFGVVTAAKGARSLGRRGKLDFTVDYLSTAGGAKVPLRSTQTMDGKSRKGAVIAVSLLLTPLGLFMKGKNITVPPGEVIEAYVDSTTRLPDDAFTNAKHTAVKIAAQNTAAQKIADRDDNDAE